jgi:CheY-like chemotaxis protein
MPEMDGFMLARTIKTEPTIAKTPLIVLTSLGQSLTPQCLAIGMDDYLSKPVRTGELQTALERWKLRPQP